MELTEELEIGQLYEWKGVLHILYVYLSYDKGYPKAVYIHKGDILMYLGITYEFRLTSYKYKFLFGTKIGVLDREECGLLRRCI